MGIAYPTFVIKDFVGIYELASPKHLVIRYNVERMGSGKLSGADYEILAAFRYQIRQFLHFSEEAARKAGLNPQQHQALLALKGLPEGADPSIGAIAARLHIRHHSAVELVERLERTGFVRKRRVTGDRRHVRLETTARGEQVLEELSLAHREELESQGPGLIKALDQVITKKSGTNGKKETC